MSNIYIAVNGDDVGSRIGQAIANDDHEGLTQASSSIQGAHDSIDQWVNSIGGKKISSAGDDAIYMVPEQAVNDLDGIRESYKEQSGHGLTVGVGPSMSQASKALIYGKLNGKDQTIHYEPMIEDYLQDEDEEQPEVPEQDDLQDQADADMEIDSGSGALEDAPPAGEDDENSAVPGQPAAQMPQQSTKNPVDDNAQMEEDMDPAASEEDADENEQPPIGNEDDISDDNQVASEQSGDPVANKTPAQKMNKNPQANTAPIDGKTDEDFGTSEEDLAEDGAGEMPEQSDEDMPDTDPEADEANMMGTDEEGGPAAEGAPVDDEASQDDMDGSSVHDDAGGAEGHDELSDDDVAQAGDEDNGEDPLASMIHGDMQEGEEQDPEAEGDDSDLDDELRNDIATALMSFKQNKDMLEQAREQNPELYNATLTMLRSMIAMAKKLGFAPEQDMADQENGDQMEQEFPEAEGADEMPEAGEEEMPAEEEPAPTADQGMPPAKK